MKSKQKMCKCKNKHNNDCCPQVPIVNQNILSYDRWQPRDCCCESRNNVDKYAIAALTQQNSLSTILVAAALFNGDYHHDKHRYYRKYDDNYGGVAELALLSEVGGRNLIGGVGGLGGIGGLGRIGGFRY
jgi:hypothetical protein